MSVEERVRVIVREEIARAFEALAVSTDVLNVPYETDELKQSALFAIADAADEAIRLLAHGTACEMRSRSIPWRKCTCHVENSEQ